MEKKDIYSIRKSKVGAVSAKIAAVVFLSLAGGAALNTVDAHAEEVVAETASTTEEGDLGVQKATEETTIKSPVEYTADPTKEVGTKEVTKEGTDGKLVTVEDGTAVVKRTEPTPTEVTLGTKPKVETTTTEKAKTEYVEDKNLEAGKQEVVTKAQDASTTTTTTYKIVTTPKVDLGKDVEDALKSDKYMYTDEKLYSVDESKELPSDKIKIDKLFVAIPEKQNLGNETSAREFIQTNVLRPQDGDLKGKAITPEMLDPNNSDIRKIKYDGVKYLQDTVSYGDNFHKFDYSKDEDLYYDLFQKNYLNLIMLSYGNYLEVAYTPDGRSHLVDNSDTQEAAIKRYFARNILTESMYADAKANYLRLKFAEEKLNNLGKIDKQDTFVKTATDAFNTLTQWYNSLNGYDKNLNIKYVGNIPNEVKKKYEEELLKLPYEIRKNLGQLIVTTEKLPTARHTDDPIGITTGYTKAMMQKYEEERERAYPTENGKATTVDKLKQPDALLDNFMHEISHVVDSKAGQRILGAVAWGYSYATAGKENWFNNTKEFKDIYNKYLSTAVDYKAYYKDNIEEAFADTLGEYINKKIYGVPYTRYKKIGDVVYEFKDSQDKNYATAYTPLDIPEVEGYFAALYTKLFEQPTEANVVVNTIKTTATSLQNGLIKVGTKAKEEIELIPFKTILRDNPSLTKGLRQTIQAGVNGEKVKTTTYSLVNKETGELTSTVSENIVKNVIDEIIEVGTKEVKQTPKRVDVRTEKLPYKTITRENPNLKAGERRVIQKGVEGSQKVVRDDIYEGEKLVSTGKEYILEKVDPVDEIIEVGTKEVKQTPKRVDVRTEKLPYKTITRENPNLKGGERRVIQKGVEGSQKVVRDDIYEGEKLISTGKEYILEKVDAVDEIIEVGTKKEPTPIIPPKDPKDKTPKGKDETPKDGTPGETPKGNDETPKGGSDVVAPTITKGDRVLPKTDAANTSAAGAGLIALVGAAVLARRKENK